LEAGKPSKSPNKNVIYGTIAIAVVIVIVALVLLLGMNNNNNNGNNQGNTHIPQANLQIVTYNAGYTGLLGDHLTATVKVTNTGDAIGTKTLWVVLSLGQNTYRGSKVVTLAPAETVTYTIDIGSLPWYSSGGSVNYYLS